MQETLRNPHRICVWFMVIGSIWFVVGTLYGLFGAVSLVAPEFFNNIPWLVFGRVRPSHVNTVIFGFLCNIYFGCGFYFMPTLLRTRMWSETLGWLTLALWNVAVFASLFALGSGHSQGREYAEYLFVFDVMIVLAILFGAINGIMTLVHRKEKFLYVSIWYFIGTFIWVGAVYPIGNVMWRPWSGALPGIVDSIVLWFYGHDLPGLLMTPLAVGTAYYVLPRVTRTPLYSHTLSLIGFWTLVMLYTHIGGHHILQAPVPDFLKVCSSVNSMGMVVPVFVVVVNLWLTARERGGAVLADPAGRLVMLGVIWYVLTSVQGSLQSQPDLQRVTHFNNWTIGHAHIAVLGFAGFICLGGLWHILPLVTGRELYSKRLVNMQFGLLMLGLTGFFGVLTIAGLMQGHAWYNGETVYRALPEIATYMGLRAGLGLSIIAAALIGLYNVVMTIRHGVPLRVPDEGGPEPDGAARIGGEATA